MLSIHYHLSNHFTTKKITKHINEKQDHHSFGTNNLAVPGKLFNILWMKLSLVTRNGVWAGTLCIVPFGLVAYWPATGAHWFLCRTSTLVDWSARSGTSCIAPFGLGAYWRATGAHRFLRWTSIRVDWSTSRLNLTPDWSVRAISWTRASIFHSEHQNLLVTCSCPHRM